MLDDISHILDNWKYSDFDLNVRIISGSDGTPKLQMRLDLGLLQMELDGRPDGRRPKRHNSYLEYYEYRLKQRQKKKVSEKSFGLTAVDCFRLQQEAIQFYHRYLALMKLKDYPRVSRDTERNIRTIEFVQTYADNDEIIWQFQQHLPYVTMMNTRARASMLLDQSDYDQALQLVQQAINQIERFTEQNEDRLDPDNAELEFLKYWYDEIEEQRPLSEHERLEKELDAAVEKEDYELAAVLRDRLAALK